MVEEGLAKKIAKELAELQESGKKTEKDFKLSFVQKLGEKKKMKMNYALVIFLKTNGNFDIRWRRITDDQVYIKEVDSFHSTTTDSIGYYKKYPVLIIPEWDLQALSRKYLWDMSGEGRYAKPQSVIIHNIEKAMGQMKMKGGMGGKSVIWIILIVAAIGYLIYQGALG
jgi:hypothetical protein